MAAEFALAASHYVFCSDMFLLSLLTIIRGSILRYYSLYDQNICILKLKYRERKPLIQVIFYRGENRLQVPGGYLDASCHYPLWPYRQSLCETLYPLRRK